MNRPESWKGWSLALSVGVGIVVLVTLPPFVGEPLRAYLMQGFAAVCHQLPGRSPHIEGVQLAVCHRCFGIYAGLPLAAFIYLLVSTRLPAGAQGRWFMAFSLIPIGLDWGGDAVGLWANSPASRTATGMVFGLVAGLYFVRAMVEAISGPGRKGSSIKESDLAA